MAGLRRNIVVLTAGFVVVLVLALGGGWALWARLTRPPADPRRTAWAILPAEDQANSNADSDATDVAPHEMPRLQPGVKVASRQSTTAVAVGQEPSKADAARGARIPTVGSQLLLHGAPRVAVGDVTKVPPSLARLVGLFHLTIMADVELDESHEPPRYRLAQVALGLATDVNGEEMIVSTRALGSLGVTLGFMERSSLAGNEACLDQALQVARTSTMLVFDVTAIQRLDQNNRSVLHRHAVLVASDTGTLSTIVWALEPDQRARARLLEDKMRLLPAALEEDRQLYVDAGEFVLGVPAQEAFALVDLPPGISLPVSDELRSAAAADFRTPEEAQRLERQLRAVVEATQQK